MRVLVATPAFGGQFTLPYVLSFINTDRFVRQEKLCDDFDLFALGTESLIGRARNICAKYALDYQYDKLLFIDADMSWEPLWVQMLLESDKRIIGGTYPLKSFPISMNFNALPEHADVFGKHRQIDNYLEFARKYADANGEVEVRHIPTGFMMIDVSVFEELADKVRPYQTFSPDTKETKYFYDFFPSGATDGGGYESEDWAFCRIARETGIKIHLQTKIVCGHVGVHHYQLGQHVVLGQLPLIRGRDEKD